MATTVTNPSSLGSTTITSSSSSSPSSSSPSSASTQLIDADGNFVGTLPVCDADAHLTSYRTVAVVGCQSGGKSTLLNRVFGTTFPVLDAPLRGRRRTTLGVWAAIAPACDGDSSRPSSSSTRRYVVLDVEGTDSRERGEGAKTFENRTTLFTLALSDCVLVNMWAHDIGRYSAANYELFDTVFAHALALRQRWRQQRQTVNGEERSSSRNSGDGDGDGTGAALLSGRPVNVVIVVRDHDGESLPSDIKRVLMGDLRNIWEGLRAGDVALEEVFSIDVVTLPHMTYAAGAFDTGVKDLSHKLHSLLFFSPNAATQQGRRRQKQQHISQQQYRQCLAPLGGFDALADQVWTAVSDCAGGGLLKNGLDLPRQAALAAYYKCGEIIRLLWDYDSSSIPTTATTTNGHTYVGQVGQAVQALRIDVETNWHSPLSDFGTRLRNVAESALALYDQRTAGYSNSKQHTINNRLDGNNNTTASSQDAVAQRRLEFGCQLLENLREIKQRYVSICWEFCMNAFDDEFRPLLGGTRGFERSARRMAKTAVSKYRNYVVVNADTPSVLNPFVQHMQQQHQVEQQTENNRNMGMFAPPGGASGSTSEDSALAAGAEEVDVVGLQFDNVVDMTTTNTNDNGNNISGDDDDDLDDLNLTLTDDHRLLPDNLGSNARDVEQHEEEDDDDEHEQWSVDRFKREVAQKIDERKRMGELMLPGGVGYGPAGPKQDPWWKGLVIRGLILFINYLQASQGHRAALKMQREHDKEFPPGPTF